MARSTHWDVYLHNKYDPGALMLQMVEEFGLDGYLYTRVPIRLVNDQRHWHAQIIRHDDFVVDRTTVQTPDGSLWQERTFPKHDQPTTTRGLIKSADDFKIYLRYFYDRAYDIDTSTIDRNKRMMGDKGAVAATIGMAGQHSLMGHFDGKLEPAVYFCMDHPGLVAQWVEKEKQATLFRLERLLDARSDYIELRCSGMLTLSQPQYARQYCLPTLQKVTRLCREAGIPSNLHCCGKATFFLLKKAWDAIRPSSISTVLWRSARPWDSTERLTHRCCADGSRMSKTIASVS